MRWPARFPRWGGGAPDAPSGPLGACPGPAAAGRRRARVLGLVVGVGLLVTLTSLLAPVDTDIAVYWKASQRVFNQGIDPYPRQPGDRLPFTYPPTALFLLYPFSQLDMTGSTALMLGVNLLLSMVVMVLIVGDLSRDDPSGRLLYWGPIYVAAFGGVYLNLVFCQINLIVLLCLWLFWRQVRRGAATFSSGGALALGCVAKPHYGLLLLAAGPRPRPRLLAGILLTGVALLGLSVALAPAGSWTSWIDDVLANTSYTALPAGHSSIAAPWNRAIPGLVARFFVPNKFIDPVYVSLAAARWLSLTLVLALLAGSAWMLYQSMCTPGRRATDRDLELSLNAVFIFLAAPASWTHHLVMLLPATLVLLRDGVLDRGEPLASRLTAALVLAVLAFTFDDLIPKAVRTASLPIMSLMSVAVIALWLLIAERLRRRLRLRRDQAGAAFPRQ